MSHCTIHDAALYRGQDAALVSWSEPAYEAEEILMNVVNRFYWIFPSDKAVSDDRFMNLVINSDKAVLMPRHGIVEIRGGARLSR